MLSADKLQEYWDHVRSSIRQRQTQLDDMLLECRQFEELHSEFDRWLVTVEQELASDPAQKLNTQRLNKQNKVNVLLVLEKHAFGGQLFEIGVVSLISFWH